MTKSFNAFSESARKNNPPRQEDAHAAAVEAPAAARATTLKKRDATTTPLIQTMAFWDWHVKEHCHDVDPGVLIDVRAALTSTWLERKFQFCQAALSWMPRSDRLNSPSIWESSSCLYSSDLPGCPMPLLFWAGGTYARRPEDVPQEQSSAAWMEEFLLPLELKTPRFRTSSGTSHWRTLRKHGG